MISKELLCEVMNIKIEDIVDLKMFGKKLNYYEKCLLNFCCDGRLSKHKDSIYKSVNIYELAHKCKEWAIKQEFYVLSNIMTNTCVAQVIKAYSNNCSKTCYENTEPEAIFKACQWILDNKSGSSE